MPGDVLHITCLVYGCQARVTAAQIVRRIKPNAGTDDLCAITPVKRIDPHLKCTRCVRIGVKSGARRVYINIAMQKLPITTCQ